MTEIIERDLDFVREVWDRDKAIAYFKSAGEDYKAELVAAIPDGSRKTLSVEHPTGETTCVMELDDSGAVTSAAMLRTARKLMDGIVFA